MSLNPRSIVRLLSVVAIAVSVAFSFCPLNNCVNAQEEAIVLEEAEQNATIESVDDADAKSNTDKDTDTESEQDYNKPWEEIVSPIADQDAEQSDSSSNVASAKLITLKSLGWLYPLVFLLVALLVLGWLLALMTRFIARNDKPRNVAVGKTETEFGHIFLSRPTRCDDLTRIQGIDSEAQGRLNAAGIYQIDQLKNMTSGQLAVLCRKVSLPRLDRASFSDLEKLTSVASGETAGTTGSDAVAGAASVATAALAGTAASVAKPKIGSASTKVPEPHFNRKNNLSGVVAHTGGSASTKVNHAVGVTNGSAAPNAESTDSNASDTAFPAGQGGSTGLPTTAQDETVTQDFDRSFRTLYSSAPSNPDDLTTLAGIDATAAAKLNAAGIYKFDQLKNLDGKQKTVLASQLDFKESDFNEWQRSIYASGTLSSVTGIPAVELSDSEKDEFKGNFGVLYSSPPADADDLTRLSGMDANTAAKLNAAGIYKFDQLKNLEDKQEALLATQLGLDDSNFADWRRCMYAWDRGINTSAEIDDVREIGELHGISLPQIANGIFDGEKLVAYPEQVIFRGSNPEGWGRAGSDEIENVETSLGCDSIRGDINYLRIRRADTRESVVLPMTKGQLFANGDQSENGWNGSAEVFFGGRHIGVFAQQLPQEVETKFSQGGWGFGHRYDHNDRQEWGWAGRVIEPTTFEISVGCAGELPGTIVFRGSDPSIWNTRSRDGEFGFADPVGAVKHTVNFVRIMRHATGEAVIVRVDGNHLLDEGFDPRVGWNGSGSEFSGGMHLGVYHSDLPQDFETRFEFGGWGFGHPYDDNDRQAWGWGGRQLPKTVFEIMLLDVVPEFMSHEIIE
jgi:predicted flap endonuclease-1-like 5' DNA nuclease